jgi:hypothetical protein
MEEKATLNVQRSTLNAQQGKGKPAAELLGSVSVVER